MGDGHGGIVKVASLWTLRGWSPPWTRATVILRGLKLHQRGCTIAPPIGTTAKTSVSPIAFAHSNPIPLHSCKLHALLSTAYCMNCVKIP